MPTHKCPMEYRPKTRLYMGCASRKVIFTGVDFLEYTDVRRVIGAEEEESSEDKE